MTIKATTKALLGTAVSFALLGTASIANAADLDNLSDDDLLARIERLEKIIGPGDAYALRSGNNKIRLAFSGQFHRQILGFFDGDEANVGLVDPTQLSSRVRWRASGQLNDDISVSGILEADIDTGTNGAISQDVLNIGAGNNAGLFSLRHSAFTLKSKTFGGITLGQTNTSSNGSTENDFSGTGFFQYFSQSDVGANIFLTNDNGTGRVIQTAGVAGLQAPLAGGATLPLAVGAAPAAGNVVVAAPVAATQFQLGDFIGGDFDGTNRDDVIRYDTPDFAGFSATASYTNGGAFAVAASYKNKDIAGFGVGATIAYSDLGNQAIGGADTSGQDNDRISGSIAAIHLASGFNAVFGAAFDGEDTGNSNGNSEGASQLYGKVGWRGDVIDLGKTSIAADFAVIRDVANEGSRANQISVSANQTIDAIATDLYVGYRRIDVTETGIAGIDFNAVNFVFAGGRVSF